MKQLLLMLLPLLLVGCPQADFAPMCSSAAFLAADKHAEKVCPTGTWEECPYRELIESELDLALQACQEIR